MHKKSRRMALCGMMCALGTTIMLLGGMIPLATFWSPALAGLTLLPLVFETNRKMALAAYAAITALSLMLSPDKESALLFAFLGYYPVLKWRLDRIANRPLRLLSKLAVFDGAAIAMVLTMIFLLNMQAVMDEYAAMSQVMFALFIVLANTALLLYDRLLLVLSVVYLRKFRPKFFADSSNLK